MWRVSSLGFLHGWNIPWLGLRVMSRKVNSLFLQPGELLVIFIGSATLVWWPAKGTYKLLENIS